MNTTTKQALKARMELETGKKISVRKNFGTMKHYTTFRIKGCVTHTNIQDFEFDLVWGKNFVRLFPGALFINNSIIDIPNKYLSQ